MFHQQKISPRHAAVYLITMLFLMLLLPWACIKLFPSALPDSESSSYNGKIPKSVQLYITEEQRIQKIPFEKYVQGVVASEMPASFESEALKAQAVASRTYALGRINAGTQLCDTVHCQVYRDHDISPKVKRAVKETAGQVLLYHGKLAAHALYFSSSAGPTENAQDVFSGTYAYLVSTDSSNEPGATHKKETVSMTFREFSKKLRKSAPEKEFGRIKKSSVKILSHTAGGRVGTMRIGKCTVSGNDVRTALGLYSTRFTISFRGNRIIFTTAGSGHGVGMSQYGANGLAKDGKNYRQILSHYYKNTKVSRSVDSSSPNP